MISTQNYHQKLTTQHIQSFSYPTTTALERDEHQEPPSLSSSPISQYSTIYQTEVESHPSILSSDIPAIAIPRSVGAIEGHFDGSGYDWSLVDHPQPMNSDDWTAAGLFRPKLSRGHHHNRESSLSSLGSGGPTSPYPHSGITPRIAIADAGADGLHGMADYHHDVMWPEANYALDSKVAPIGHASDHFFPTGLLDGQGHHGMPFGTSPVAQRQRGERGGGGGLAPPVEFPNIRHGPDSVASSTIGGDSPATPAMGEPIDDRRRIDVFREAPKFERSSIYSNNMALGSSSPSQQHFSPSSQFSRAIEAANSQHLHVDQSPSGYRGSSPFRNGSPLAPIHCHDLPRAAHYPIAAPQHDGSPATAGPTGTPQTISPKDAVLELDDVNVDGDGDYAMFHSQPAGGYGGQQGQFMRDPTATTTVGHHLQYIDANPSVDVRVPQQYPFIPSPMHGDNTRRIFEAPQPTSHQVSGPVSRGAADDGGTYSCTYHGCKLRFDTQKDLQTHKREGHRAAGVARRADRGDNQQTQHGPHICNRINPSTNKVCGSKFSRPYDLTRHEDTIHNANKKKLRCRICPEEKLFSRRDALNRHFKVCHEELYETEFPRRRRANRA